MLFALASGSQVARAQGDTAAACRHAGVACARANHEADVVNVVASQSPIPLDARLTDSIWLSADSITDFRQREPTEGARATERTVVKVARDAHALYVAVRAD